MKNGSLLSVVEAAYALDGDEDYWLTGLCEAAAALIDPGLGTAIIQYDATTDDYVHLTGVKSTNAHPEVVAAMFSPGYSGQLEQQRLVQVYRRRGMSTMRRVFDDLPGFAHRTQTRLTAAGYPNADMIGVMAPDPSHHGCLLAAFSGRPLELHPRTIARWSRAAAHIATGWRIRQRLRALEATLLTESPEAEAIFEPGGRTAHATGDARSADARERLRAAVVAFEKARRASTDPDEALALWEALVDGRWSLLDCFDHDGRRYWVAHRNDPDVPEISPLSEREQQVAAYAALGLPNKLIAYELGLSIATVARDLKSARTKLGADSRVDLVRKLGAGPSLGPSG